LQDNWSRVHGTKSFESGVGARIDRLVIYGVPVTQNLEFNEHVARDLRDSVDIEGQGTIVRGENDVEEGGREAGVGHAGI
jgi:hypothetical protein